MTLELKLLRVLNHIEWQRTLELQQRIKNEFGKAPSAAFILIELEQMQERGWVESKKGDDPEILKTRGGREYFLYRLTEGGIQHRRELGQKQPAALGGEFVPQTS